MCDFCDAPCRLAEGREIRLPVMLRTTRRSEGGALPLVRLASFTSGRPLLLLPDGRVVRSLREASRHAKRATGAHAFFSMDERDWSLHHPGLGVVSLDKVHCPVLPPPPGSRSPSPPRHSVCRCEASASIKRGPSAARGGGTTGKRKKRGGRAASTTTPFSAVARRLMEEREAGDWDEGFVRLLLREEGSAPRLAEAVLLPGGRRVRCRFVHPVCGMAEVEVDVCCVSMVAPYRSVLVRAGIFARQIAAASR